MNADTMSFVMGLLGFAVIILLAAAWINERDDRQEAELEAELLRREAVLARMRAELKEEEEAYNDTKADMDANPIPSDMLDDVGKPVPEHIEDYHK